MEIKRKTFVISYPDNKMENQKKKKGPMRKRKMKTTSIHVDKIKY